MSGESEKRESVAEVVASMRRYGDGMRTRYKEAAQGDKYLSCDVMALRMDEYANRLEAAHERELAAARREPRTWEACIAEYQKRKEAGEYGPY